MIRKVVNRKGKETRRLQTSFRQCITSKANIEAFRRHFSAQKNKHHNPTMVKSKQAPIRAAARGAVIGKKRPTLSATVRAVTQGRQKRRARPGKQVTYLRDP